MEAHTEIGTMDMEKASIAEALRALASDSENRTKIGRLRELYPDIETAQKAGVSNSKIVETLKAQGLDVTLKTFETMLYRLRKELGKTRKPAQEGTSVIQPASTPAEPKADKDADKPETQQTSTSAPPKAKRRDIDLSDYSDPD
jgi:hypothetical protein